MGFVGRTRERADLANFLSQVGTGKRADAGFAVALRGRRRIGKSRLVDEFIRAQGIPYVWFQGAKGAPAEAEISKLAEAIATSTLPNAVVAQSVKPESLTAALNLLSAALPTDGPAAVVLDELPWLLEAIPGGAGELQRVWDRTLSRQPVLLILIGSDLAMMEQLTEPDQPFHGRARSMTLNALSPRDVAEMTQLSPLEAFDAYLITGGQPQVVEEWALGTAPEEFLRDSFASPNSALVASGMRVLDSEFRDAAIARQVLTAIGGHGERVRTNILESAQTLGSLTGPTLDEKLEELRAKRVVVADTPLSTREAKSDRRWRIEDPALRFWLAFVEPALDEIDRNRPDLALRRFKSGYSSWRGRAIEPVVRESVWRLLPDTPWADVHHVGGWWPRNNVPEIDIVGAVRRPGEVRFVGTIKWRSGVGITSTEREVLASAATKVPGVSASTPLVAVCPAGSDDEGFSRVWTAEDLLHAWPR